MVDWESVPYAGPDVLEWYRRFQGVSAIYNERFKCERVLAGAKTYDASWVVWPIRSKQDREYLEFSNCSGLVRVYADRSYVVLRVLEDRQSAPEPSGTTP